MGKPRIGYWNIRGYAQPIRLLLAYTGTDFEDKRYNYIQVADDWDPTEWLAEKFSLGLDFPNIPYYIDDDVKLSQTFAILKYLGRKHNLAPLSEDEHIRVDLIEAEADDMRTKWSNLCYYESDFETAKVEYLKNVKVKLTDVSKYLANHDYIAGNHITYIDFLMYELLDIHSLLEPTIPNDFANLKAYHARIQELPTVAAYMKSDKFLAKPLNAQMAAWGGK